MQKRSIMPIFGEDEQFAVLVLISSIWAQRTKWTLTRALIGGAQPMEGWWAPVAQPHKREVRTSGTTYEVRRSYSSYYPKP